MKCLYKNFFLQKEGFVMKGVSIAIETIIYLILAILVLTVLITFFLTQAGPAQDQYTLEAKRNSLCGAYVSMDFSCVGRDDGPKTGEGGVDPTIPETIASTCSELNRRFGFAYRSTAGSGGGTSGLNCIRSCCITCPVKTPVTT